jgi:hypothetical protein
MTPPTKSTRARRNAKICRRAPPARNHTRIVEPICHKLLLHKKERWKTTPHPRLLTYQQMDEEE